MMLLRTQGGLFYRCVSSLVVRQQQQQKTSLSLLLTTSNYSSAYSRISSCSSSYLLLRSKQITNLKPTTTTTTTTSNTPTTSSRYLTSCSIGSSSSSKKNQENKKTATMPPVNGDEKSIEKYVEELIEANKVLIFSKTTCPWCAKVKELFKSINEPFLAIELDVVENGDAIKKYVIGKTNQTTVPNVFVAGTHVGGFDNTSKAQKQGTLTRMLNSDKHKPSNSNLATSASPRPKPSETIEDYVNKLLDTNKVVVFGKTTCPYCAKVKELFKSLNEPILVVELDEIPEGPEIRDYLFERTGQKTVPNVFVQKTHLGGYDNTQNAHKGGRLTTLLKKTSDESDSVIYDYDLIVIGGGSGGLACSKAAAQLGAKTAVLDFVKPTPIGTTWGLGGTCVNVGCIPKKLMHQSAILGESIHDSKEFGWQPPEDVKHNWQTMREAIQNYIGSLNFNYRVQLRDKKVEYMNAFGTLLDKNRILASYKNGKTKEITAKNIVVAVGGRPKYPEEIKGAKEYCISSDDLFSLSYNPGKTLCVGASYVSLECAGFLKGIGLDVAVMVRSILLRGFDQQMANLIGEFMEQHGIRFIRESIPTEIVRIKAPTETEAGEVLVKYKGPNGEIKEEMFNTVLLAVGRDPCTADLNLDKIGIQINPKNKKILTTFEQTNIDNIYAIGDVVDESSANGRLLELTPVAIKAGQLLANRLFGKSDVKMDYYAVPTTVFTPIEYGSIGYSEEEAQQQFGESNIEVFHTKYWPLEWTVAHKPHDVCYAKLICNKLDKMRVIGLHVAGPNAGEITQGYAVAIKLRATKKDFDMTVGIHPTCSEIFTTLTVSKSSGEDSGGKGC